jgi:hypothetical protein
MATPNMHECDCLEGAFHLCTMEVQIARAPRSSKHMVPFVDQGHTAYRSQGFGRVQQEFNECDASPVGFSEGLYNPSYHQEEDCQGDV